MRARHGLALALAASLVAVGCGSTETVEDKRPDPVTNRTAPADPPRAEVDRSPPLGKPRPKVAPSAATPEKDLKGTDSFYRDETPH